MAAEDVGVGGGGDEEETTTTTTTTTTPCSSSAPGSPTNKVKFLCSHGGKILPRPADGHLKYVGGETRVVSVPRDINISELMKKLGSLSDGDIVLKYQLIPEDLDALVSVKSDEDLRHMLDEYDRYETAGAPRLRAFLFPANPIIMEMNQMSSSSMEPHALEQRYIDAVNGIIRATMASVKLPTKSNGNASPTGLSSAGSSPRSPASCNTDSVNHEIMLQNGRLRMHRVRSSPSISSLNNSQHHSIHRLHQNYHQVRHHGYQSPTRAQTPERLVSVRSVGRADSWKYQGIPSPSKYYPIPIARHSRGSG